MFQFVIAFVIFIVVSRFKNKIQENSSQKIAEQFKVETIADRINLSHEELKALMEGYTKRKGFKFITVLKVLEVIVFVIFLSVGFISLFSIGKGLLYILFHTFALLSILNAAINFAVIHNLKKELRVYFKEKGNMHSPQMIEVFKSYIKESYIVYCIGTTNIVFFLSMMSGVVH